MRSLTQLYFSEKNDLTEECRQTVKAIKQMEASIDDTNTHHDHAGDLEITYPLMRCLQSLKQKYAAISKLHRERVEQVKSEQHIISFIRAGS